MPPIMPSLEGKPSFPKSSKRAEIIGQANAGAGAGGIWAGTDAGGESVCVRAGAGAVWV